MDLTKEPKNQQQPWLPAASTMKLTHEVNGALIDNAWHYRCVIGKLDFLEKSTQIVRQSSFVGHSEGAELIPFLIDKWIHQQVISLLDLSL